MTDEATMRVELAAVFRIAAKFDWHESIANHFSAAVSADGTKFLMNPKWSHFSQIRASDLQLLDVNDDSITDGLDAPDVSAWAIHGAIHSAVPAARVLLHAHPTYTTAISSLADPTILPIDQNTARYFGEVAYDLGFNGIAEDMAEGQRLAGVMRDFPVLMMGSHGVTVSGPSVAHAFESLYYLEKACRNLVLAYSTGQPLAVLHDDMAAKVAKGWKRYADMGDAHFAAQMAILDSEDPSYRD
jgi:ribulose-5-phosphate 4-epimerase/fuculose-1-phosphate aldolase